LSCLVDALHVVVRRKKKEDNRNSINLPSLFLHQQNQRNPSCGTTDMEFECFTDNDKLTEEHMEETIPIVEGVKRNATFSIEYEPWPKKIKQGPLVPKLLQIPTITETEATSSEVGRLIPNASMEASPNVIVNTKDQCQKMQQAMKFEYLHRDMLAEKKEMLAFLRRRLKVYFLQLHVKYPLIACPCSRCPSNYFVPRKLCNVRSTLSVHIY
jgi:hypothetical protein